MKESWKLAPLGLFVLAFVLFVMPQAPAGRLSANGGRNGECEDAQGRSIGGSDSSISYTIPDGLVASGVCIKSGTNMFGDGHSESLQNGTYFDGCYTVSGVGTGSVTVTRNEGGSQCQGLSHIDVYYGTPVTPTTTPIVTPTAGVTPTEGVTPTSGATPTPTSPSNPTPTNGSGDGGSNGGGSNGGGSTVCNDAKPEAVTLSLSQVNATTVHLTWTEAKNANTYLISYGTAPGQYVYGVADTGNTRSFDVGGLMPNTKYYFVVYAKNGCAIGNASNEVSNGGQVLGAYTSRENGQVLGASTDSGDVLGASTMAATGTAPITASLLSIVMGTLSAAAGVLYRKR